MLHGVNEICRDLNHYLVTFVDFVIVLHLKFSFFISLVASENMHSSERERTLLPMERGHTAVLFFFFPSFLHPISIWDAHAPSVSFKPQRQDLNHGWL